MFAESNPLLRTIERLVASSVSSLDVNEPNARQVLECYKTLQQACYWTERGTPGSITADSMVPDLIQDLLKSIEDPVDFREILPPRTNLVMKAFELVGAHEGWVWTFNTLIVGQLWTLMAPNAQNPKLIPAVVRLIGMLGKKSNGEGLDELRRRMNLLLDPQYIQKYNCM